MAAATYSYLADSALSSGGLALQTSGGPSAHPYFFSGLMVRPDLVASGLSAVAEVARTEYFQRAGMRRGTALGGSLDPVVTAGEGRLRFESFSGCCGVHAQLDVLPAGLDGTIHEHGTTNVDVGVELQRALARVSGRSTLGLEVGSEELVVATASGTVREQKVPLPSRWLRGFAETAAITTSVEPRLEVTGQQARAFLQRVRPADRAVQWAVQAGSGIRLTSRPTPGAVCVPGAGRLSAVLGFARFVDQLTVYGPLVNASSPAQSSVWQLSAGPVRLTLHLSAAPSRGFSGEGAVLEHLVGETVDDDADLLAAQLSWDPAIDPDALVTSSGLPLERVRAALMQLATSGRVGRDVAEGTWFHRSLPYEQATVELLNPRLARAQVLESGGAVSVTDHGFQVRSGTEVYQVRLRAAGPTCTCEWWSRYLGERGPCTHVLAVQLSVGSGVTPVPSEELR